MNDAKVLTMTYKAMPKPWETCNTLATQTIQSTAARVMADQSQGQYKSRIPTSYDKDAEAGLKGYPAAKYPQYLPTWDPEQKSPPLKAFEYHDRGKNADPSYPELLPKEVAVKHLTPTIGSEITGVQLSQLTAAGKDQLARFVAERKVVAFRDQDFASLPIAEAVEFARYFGPLHVHSTSGAPAGFPEVHLVHRAAGDQGSSAYFESHTTSVAWHSDVTYEAQPPGIAFLYVLEKPETGGDTLFADTVQAYRRLSPAIQERLHGLYATHSGLEQANASSARGGVVRREPLVSTHPIVRTHPVTGEKALFVNPQSTREIVGFKKEESAMLLKFLQDHIATGANFHARLRW
ncbi:hypothetical protein PWT90_01734 [Aphanocladium album]|nr:hypothetical protein PWT90_01734 [Aphanocladium album]